MANSKKASSAAKQKTSRPPAFFDAKEKSARAADTEDDAKLDNTSDGADVPVDVVEPDETSPDDDQEAASAAPSSRRRKPVDHESFAHRLYVSDFNIDFVGKRRVWYLISGVLVVVCILSLSIRHLNLGVEFTGGSVFTVNQAINDNTITEYTDVVNAVNLPDMGDMQVTTLRTAGSDQVRIQTRSLDTAEVAQMTEALGAHAGIPAAQVGTQLIGPSWGTQITWKGVQALVIFLVLVALMMGLYFRNWKMSLAALIALFHDLLITVGLYSLVGFTVTPATITGVLTILGYSLYDNVVVFDKVRENSVNLERQDFTFSQAADLAVNQVFVRSINTTIVGVLPVLSLLIAGVVFLGGQGPLPDLGLAMFVGMITGAWSSIFIATPILAQLKEREPAMKQHRESLERRLGRAQTHVLITSTVSEQVPVLAGAQITTAPVPVRHAAAAGRPQPERLPRSQRKA